MDIELLLIIDADTLKKQSFCWNPGATEAKTFSPPIPPIPYIPFN